MTKFPTDGDNFRTIGLSPHQFTLLAYRKAIDAALRRGDSKTARELMEARDEIKKRGPQP